MLGRLAQGPRRQEPPAPSYGVGGFGAPSGVPGMVWRVRTVKALPAPGVRRV
jgi:hypothetical protein